MIKVITNMLAFIHLVADGEALMLAKKGGARSQAAFDVIKASSGNSFVHETEGQVILNGSYNINFTMDLAVKDLGFAHQMGREFGVPLDLAGLTEQIFARARAPTAAAPGRRWWSRCWRRRSAPTCARRGFRPSSSRNDRRRRIIVRCNEVAPHCEGRGMPREMPCNGRPAT